MIKGVKFVNIPVADQARALAFYTEKLGFTVATNQPMAPDGPRWIELKIPGAETRVSLFTPPGHEDRVGTFVPLSLWADEQDIKVVRQLVIEVIQRHPKCTDLERAAGDRDGRRIG